MPTEREYRDFEEKVRKAAREQWGDFYFHTGGRVHTEKEPMKDVTPPYQHPPTPKPRARTVQLHENSIVGPGCYEIMMPNGHYLAAADGTPYLLRFKGGHASHDRIATATEKFQKVYDNFRRFWP